MNDIGMGGNVNKRLRQMLGVSNNRKAKKKIKDMCNSFMANEYQSSFLKYGNEFTSFGKQYFDGSTEWNEHRQTDQGTSDGTTSQILSVEAAVVNQVYDTIAQQQGMEFPDGLSNFENCDIGAAMCCWIQDRQANDNNGNCDTPYDQNCVDKDPMDNTDICYVDMTRDNSSSNVPAGFAIFEDESEGDTHCHGFAWDSDNSAVDALYKGNNLFYVSMYDHLYSRGYVRTVPGAPMCACVEQMPVVSRSDCTEMSIEESFSVTYSANSKSFEASLDNVSIEYASCEGANGNNNDLEAYFERLVNEGRRDPSELECLQEILVGEDNCEDAISDLLSNQ